MKFLFSLLCVLNLIVPACSVGQRIAVGPVAGLNRYSAIPGFEFIALSSKTDVLYKATISYGVELTYSRRRFLGSVTMLTAKQIYDVTGQIQPISPTDPIIIERVRVEGRSFAFPVGLSYRLNEGKIQVFTGLELVPTLINSDYKRRAYTRAGGPTNISLSTINFDKKYLTSSKIKLSFRSSLTKKIILQAEPYIQYSPKVDMPYILTKNVQYGFQIASLVWL